jgi:cytochrome c
MKTKFPAFFALALTGAFFPALGQAQTCAEPTASQFRVDTLVFNDTAKIETAGADTLPGGRLRGDLYENSSANGGESGNYGVVQIAMAPDGKIFIAKMCSGQIRVYDPAKGTRARTLWAGTVPTRCNNEDGLLGVVASHDYATTKWIYVFHTDAVWPTSPANADTGRAHVLTRYTYDATAAAGAQLKNPKRILRFERMIDDRAYHAAGGLDVSADGTVVIGTGDDTNPHADAQHCGQNYAPLLWNDRGCDAQKASSNTASLRGKILRIKPLPFPDTETPAMGIGTTYSIPAGNLWEKIDNPAFNPNWNASVDNLSKVRREIYTMGHRNPYHPRVDSRSGWIFTGEVGLDAGSPSTTRGPEGRDEWNLATEAGFYGHPYCVGKNTPWKKYTSPSTTWDTASYNCAAIQNLSPNNSGITNLPPARPATLFYSNASNNGDDSYRMGFTSGETAVGGPMYRYDPGLVSSVKFPPQYEGRIFFFDWEVDDKSSFRMIKMNPNGTLDSGAAATPAFPGVTRLPEGQYIDMRFGSHDGAMYVLKNSRNGYANFREASLYRIAYTGTIDNSCYAPFNTTVGTSAIDGARPAIRRTLSPAIVNGMLTLPVGYRSVTLYDLAGRKVWSHVRGHAETSEAIRIPAHFATGILQARLAP